VLDEELGKLVKKHFLSSVRRIVSSSASPLLQIMI
jgi:hypothetical protein